MGKILFHLTPEIIDMIIFGMENQSDDYCVDIKTGDVLSYTQADEEYEDKDIDSFVIPVPDWLPSDGFQLMESFVADLHNPVYKDSLREVLSVGRGAFRNFKNTVKENEVLSQQWYQHKEKELKLRVIEWYNTNCDILKYRDMDENTDETEDLIISDFIFNTDCSRWEKLINLKSDESIRESLVEADTVTAEYIIRRKKLLLSSSGTVPLIICVETIDGAFTGFIGGVLFETGSPGSMVAVSNIIWVEKEYRGMGIARHLIDDFTRKAVDQKAEKIFFELTGRGTVLNSTLESRGLSAISLLWE